MKLTKVKSSILGTHSVEVHIHDNKAFLNVKGGRDKKLFWLCAILFIAVGTSGEAGKEISSILTIAFLMALAAYLAVRRNLRRYSLDGDIGYCGGEVHETHENKIAWGSAISKMLLAGVAGNAWQRGSGFSAGAVAVSAGMLDTHYVKSTKTVSVKIHFMDGEVILSETSEQVAQWLVGAALFEDEEKFQRYERMKKDAPRVSVELRSDLKRLENLYDDEAKIAKDGDTFDERDNAKSRQMEILSSMRRVSIILDHIDKQQTKMLSDK